MFGYSAGEAIGHQLDDLVARHKHHHEAVEKTEKVMSGQRLEAFETIRYRKDGTPLHVIAAGSPNIVEDELQGVVAMYTDITGRVQSEEALKLSH
jgi:PAS domain S-box-containing protein